MKTITVVAIFLASCCAAYAQTGQTPAPNKNAAEEEAIHKAVNEIVTAIDHK